MCQQKYYAHDIKLGRLLWTASSWMNFALQHSYHFACGPFCNPFLQHKNNDSVQGSEKSNQEFQHPQATCCRRVATRPEPPGADHAVGLLSGSGGTIVGTRGAHNDHLWMPVTGSSHQEPERRANTPAVHRANGPREKQQVIRHVVA